MTDPYHDPQTHVLRNRLGLNDAQALAQAEAIVAAGHMAELVVRPIDGRFDFTHLQAIHRALLSDVYSWAGEVRTVATSPGDLGIAHDPPEAIATESERIFREIAEGDYLRGRNREDFTTGLAEHWGDLTSLHPFLDGNSRTQQVFVDQLAREAGWGIDWHELSVPALQAARNVAYLDGGTILADVIAPAVRPVDEVPPHALLGGPHPGADLTMTEHWQRMLEHLDSDTGARYTWPGRDAGHHNTETEPHQEPAPADHEHLERAATLERERVAALERERQVQREEERARAAERLKQTRRIPPPRPKGPHL